MDIYKPCPCGSGKKYKFCCMELMKSSDPKKQLEAAAAFPIYETKILEDWQTCGLAPIYVVRQLPNRKYIFGGYVVDIFCLGLKDTFCNTNTPYSSIQQMISSNPGRMVDITYQAARSIILGSIQYAASLGFHPHEDWHQSKHMIESSKPFEEKYEYGIGGAPFYVQGPHDDVEAITKKLSAVSSDHIVLRDVSSIFNE